MTSPDPTAVEPTSFDQATVEELQRSGSLKWSLFPDTIGAFVAEMDWGTAPAVTAALHRAVDAHRLGYLPPALAEQLRHATADWVAERHGWRLSPERVFPVADVLTGMAAAVQHHSPAGSAVIVPTPAYMPFLELPRTLGREVLQVPMLPDAARGFALDLDGLADAFATGGRLLVLCNPANPVGRVYTGDELDAVCAVVDRYGGTVFADEVHAPLVTDGHPHLSYAARSAVAAGHTLTTVAASKAFNMPGLKCAQVLVSNDADAQRWATLGPAALHGAGILGVVAAVAAYREGGPWLDRLRGYLAENGRRLAALLAAELPAVGYRPPEGTYVGWLDCRALGLADPATYFRERAGVAMTDGAACGEAGRGFVRLVLATPWPVLERAVRAMAAAL